MIFGHFSFAIRRAARDNSGTAVDAHATTESAGAAAPSDAPATTGADTAPAADEADPGDGAGGAGGASPADDAGLAPSVRR